MLTIHSIINTPVPSNTYIITDEVSNECLIIDPGSKECKEIFEFLQGKRLTPKYIMLTHGDFDHTWGVNTLLQAFPYISLVASRETARLIAIPQNYFSALYFNNPEYYSIEKVNVIIDDIGNQLKWSDNDIRFIQVPGHTSCSNLILLNEWLFSGDTLLKDTKPYIQRKHGGDKLDFKKSIQYIFDNFAQSQKIYPGHGRPFILEEVMEYYKTFIAQI